MPPLDRRTYAYLAGVVTAFATTLAYTIFMFWPFGSGSGTLRPDLIYYPVMFSIAYGIVVAVAALPSCIVAEVVAWRLRVRAAWYFVLCSALSAAALGPAVLALYADQEMPETWAGRYWVNMLVTADVFAPQGALCGLVYWWISRGSRAARRDLA